MATMIRRTPITSLMFILPTVAAMAGPPTGAVTGIVPMPERPAGRVAVEKYTGTISGKVASPPAMRAGVWLEGPGAKPDSAPAQVVFAQQGYQFTDSLIIVPSGASVEFPNRDNDYHNIFSLSRTKRFDLGRYKKNEAPAPVVTFDKPGLVRLKCEIHDHMNAVVLVVDSRWRVLTDTAGKFALTGVPPGIYTLHAQLDEKTRWSAPVTVTSGKTVTADFTQTPVIP